MLAVCAYTTPAAGTIPQRLRELLAILKKTDLGSNPWEEPPEAVVTQGVEAISGYFTDLFSDAITVQQRNIKVVLVGQEGAGKTRRATR